MANRTPEAEKLLIFSPEPEEYAPTVAERCPDLDVVICRDFDDLGNALAAERPSYVLATTFKGQVFPRDVLFAAPSVRWVHNAGAGVDHLVPWDPEAVAVTNVSGIHVECLSEYVICAMLTLNLNFLRFAEQQRRHYWHNEPLPSVVGKTVAVVGFGKIGQGVGVRAQALGMRVIGFRTQAASSPHAERVLAIEDLRTVVPEADFVALTVPRTPRTISLIDAAMIEAFKPGVYLVNISRGRIVDEAALLAALSSGHVAAAVIDVFATEPLPADSPFWDLPNVFVTPHTGDPERWQTRVAGIFCDNVERRRRGDDMVNVVLPDRGY
ncbi:MAG: D-2-hydroxyacid dehydrogenase [Rhodospirillales bacterium]|nr:D-2-hydroxyacid dehydrogenase [Rhodospirillales bacterium]